MAPISDPYALLGVPRGATLVQIKAAHRALAKRYHPDAPTADAKRFLRVQEAYQLLSDPLRRREWDARQAPAPVRADQPATRPARNTRRSAAGTGPTPGSAAGSARRRSPTERPQEQASRSYTWSASEVPWWEEGAREGRRGGRRRAASAPPGAEPAAGDEAGAGSLPGAGTSAGEAGSGAPPGNATAAPPPHGDFDVYSRSSGAAWSSAARAYFRRVDADLPRRGSFHRQGSQPLTAARARVAAEEEARRRSRPAASAAAAASRSAAPRRAPPPAAEAARPATFAAAQPAPASAGVAHDAEHITTVRHLARERERAAAWPSLAQRIRFALLAWLPLALLIGYGGPHAAGCADTAVACPLALAPLQALLAAGVLVLLLALPRLAFIAGVASGAVIIAGSVALLGAWLLGVRAPQAASLPAWAILGGAVVLVGAYLVAATWLLTDHRRLPWVGPAGGSR